MRWQFAGPTKPFKSLEIFDVTVIGQLAQGSGLPINRRGISHIALSEDARVTLREVLRPLDFSIAFIDFLA